ncbi:hypothetical protein ACFOTA_22005 [Chitinophaga sp. GCM10012297]|uniref:Cytochrome B n=1 Tax=Chitinophaga chungangae TaxID=2821488 RepID=A0ABS3YJQ9_9BACT|nr:hypothetical protein [Chitinophaga chungangae]MBO9154905.1 hypothetical protein [Chitinophaga chungangae]
MHETILGIHSIVRWLILLFGIWAVLRALMGVSGRKPYTSADTKAGLFFMIFLDIQFLLGLILFFVSPLIKAFMADPGAAMGNTGLRYFPVDHAVTALIAIALVHIGRSKIKKLSDDGKKHKTALIFFLLALVLILAAIPWPGREAVGRALFPSF